MNIDDILAQLDYTNSLKDDEDFEYVTEFVKAGFLATKDIVITDELIKKIEDCAKELVEKGVNCFMHLGNTPFGRMSYEHVAAVARKPQIRHIPTPLITRLHATEQQILIDECQYLVLCYNKGDKTSLVNLAFPALGRGKTLIEIEA